VSQRLAAANIAASAAAKRQRAHVHEPNAVNINDVFTCAQVSQRARQAIKLGGGARARFPERTSDPRSTDLAVLLTADRLLQRQAATGAPAAAGCSGWCTTVMARHATAL